jgi:hypothetical protein
VLIQVNVWARQITGPAIQQATKALSTVEGTLIIWWF